MIRVLASICMLISLLHCVSLQAADSYSARTNYMLMCQGCHLPDGSGTAGKVPALKDEVARFLQVPGGREYLVQVPGTSQSSLTDQETAAVLNWILENFDSKELSTDFRPYTAQEVSRLRYEPLVNANEVRLELLHKLQQGS